MERILWWFDFTLDDSAMPIIFTGHFAPITAHGPFNSQGDAARAADRHIRSIINVHRRALTVLRRGDCYTGEH